MILSLLVVIPPALRTSVAIALGAIPGALCRYYFTFWLSRWFGNDLPYATFLVNFTGAIGMGIVVTLVTAGSSWLIPRSPDSGRSWFFGVLHHFLHLRVGSD